MCFASKSAEVQLMNASIAAKMPSVE